jgi:hypothetical protein
VRALVLRATGDRDGAAEALSQAVAAMHAVVSVLAEETDRERYLTQFAFNRFIQAAQRGQWPDPPRLL